MIKEYIPSPDEASQTAPTDYCGYFEARRSDDALEMIRAHHESFILLYLIAARTRFKAGGVYKYPAEPGQAFIGKDDLKSMGISEQRYRTAKANLEKWGQATFQPTRQGTIATLTESAVFKVNIIGANAQSNAPSTHDQRTANAPPTPKVKGKKEKWKKDIGGEPRTIWGLTKLREAKLAAAKVLKDRHASECAMETHWDDEIAREDYREFMREAQEILETMASMKACP